MKKYLPLLAIAILGIAFVAGVFIIRNKNSSSVDEEEIQNIPDLPDDQRPIIALVPTSDGHYLSLKIEEINKVKDANSLDYELTWKANNAGNSTTQGTSGTVKVAGQSSYNKDILLGSESSGKFRYDQGVETGTVTLRFRNESGKLLGKVASDFHLQTNTTSLSSVDGSFKYTLPQAQTGVWFLTMKSFGKPNSTSVATYSDGWAVFASQK